MNEYIGVSSDYLNLKFRNFAAECITRIKGETNLKAQWDLTESEETRRNIRGAVWYFALGYIHGKRSEKWHSIHPSEFADYVVETIQF